MKANDLWRYSHLSLAILSSCFILILSLTGAILALEPFFAHASVQQSNADNDLNLEIFIKSSPEQAELFDIRLENNTIIANWTNQNNLTERVYIDPQWNRLGTVSPSNKFFKWVTNFHRSLLLKKTGRYIVGLASICLFLIALSGLFLIIHRQGKLRFLFKKIIEDQPVRYRHISFGRSALILILIIAGSGIILSLYKLKYLRIKQPIHSTAPYTNWSQIPLATIHTIEFPFSRDSTDPFTITTHSSAFNVHQYTGDVFNYKSIDRTQHLIDSSINIHTGKNSFIWAGFLCISCFYIVYLIFSGFKISLRKTRYFTTSNRYTSDTAEVILLVGTQGSQTLTFAHHIYHQLAENGVAVYLDMLNNYSNNYPKLKHLIVLTSTYGDGEPPKSATRFLKKYIDNPIVTPFSYSILGTGSKSYTKFCYFALEIDHIFSSQSNAKAGIPLQKVHQQSTQTINQWGKVLFDLYALDYTPFEPKESTKQYNTFTVCRKTDPVHQIFSLTLTSKSWNKIRRGDLLAIKGADKVERFYSMGLNHKRQATLCIKRHAKGLVSNQLAKLEPNTKIAARIISNPHFHFPKNKPIIGIANGTGIAPFLYYENKKYPLEIYWGIPYRSLHSTYQTALQHSLLHLAVSREATDPKQYVQDLLLENRNSIIHALRQGAVIMICGSMAMEKSVVNLFNDLAAQHNLPTVEELISAQRWLTDCY